MHDYFNNNNIKAELYFSVM